MAVEIELELGTPILLELAQVGLPGPPGPGGGGGSAPAGTGVVSVTGGVWDTPVLLPARLAADAADCRMSLGLGTAAEADTSDFDAAGAASAASAGAASALATHAGLTTSAHGGIVPQTTTVNGHPLSSDVVVVQADIAGLAYGATAGTVVQGNDARLADARTPTPHAATHKLGGSDALKLNELALPTAAVAFNGQKASDVGAPTAAGDAARWDELAIGNTGDVLVSRGTGQLPQARPLTRTITLVIDGGGAVPPTGNYGFAGVPYAGTIVGTRIYGDVSGSAVVDVRKIAYGQTAPSASIAASAKPTLSSALANKDDTVTGWTTTITKDDLIGFNLDSVTTCTKITVEIIVSVLP